MTDAELDAWSCDVAEQATKHGANTADIFRLAGMLLLWAITSLPSDERRSVFKDWVLHAAGKLREASVVSRH